MLKEAQRINRVVSIWFERLGIVALLFMMGVTCADVVATKIFLRPITGAIDMSQVSQVVGIAFAVASMQILGKNVLVNYFVDRMSPFKQAVIDCVNDVLVLALLVLIVWRLFVLGHSFQAAREVTGTLYLPLHPFIYGAAVAFIPVCFVFILEFFGSLRKAVKR
jgi:TRAP-type C4-dicarboxylate transport system permease small subunit